MILPVTWSTNDDPIGDPLAIWADNFAHHIQSAETVEQTIWSIYFFVVISNRRGSHGVAINSPSFCVVVIPGNDTDDANWQTPAQEGREEDIFWATRPAAVLWNL